MLVKQKEKTMNIDLKNIKVYDELSEETLCFTATLYIDGVNRGEVSNRGQGGCNDFDDISWKEEEKIDTWCKNNLPKYEWNGLQCETSFEVHLADILYSKLQS